jgi:hypothetical protein
MSQPHLATLVHWSQSRISRAENGSVLPPEQVAMRLDAILDAKGELLRRYRAAVVERQARDEARRALRFSAESENREVSGSDRRRVIGLAGAVAFGAALPQSATEIIAEADAPDVPARVELGDVREVERTIADLEDRHHRVGGVPTRHLVLGELRWAVALQAGSMFAEVRQRLHIAVAHLSELAGWTTFDAGRHHAARKLFLVGLKAAHESEDPGILAHAATGFARVESHTGQPKAALDFVRLARSSADELPAPAVSALHVVAGLALARLPEPQACRRHLGLAEQSFQAPVPDDPAWIGYFTEASLFGATGDVLYALARATGRRDDALTARLDTAVQSLPDSRARNKAVHAARLATLLYHAGELERANAVAVQAITLAQDIRSVVLTEDVAALGDSAGRFPHDDRAREVMRAARRLSGPHSPATTRRRSTV